MVAREDPPVLHRWRWVVANSAILLDTYTSSSREATPSLSLKEVGYPLLPSSKSFHTMALPNQLHENFARLIAEGSSSTEAYRRLKPSARHPSASASRLWSRTEIRIRVAEIVDEAVTARKLTIKQKIALIEDQIEGKSPTKVKVDSKGRKEATFDMLGALQLHSRLCGDFEGFASKQKGPVLDLKFNILGRDEPLTPEMEEELYQLQLSQSDQVRE